MRKHRVGPAYLRHSRGAIDAFLDPGHVVLELEDFETARHALRRAIEVCTELQAEGWIDGGLTLRLRDERRGRGHLIVISGVDASARLALEVASRVLEGSDEGWK